MAAGEMAECISHVLKLLSLSGKVVCVEGLVQILRGLVFWPAYLVPHLRRNSTFATLIIIFTRTKILCTEIYETCVVPWHAAIYVWMFVSVMVDAAVPLGGQLLNGIPLQVRQGRMTVNSRATQ